MEKAIFYAKQRRYIEYAINSGYSSAAIAQGLENDIVGIEIDETKAIFVQII